MNRLRRGRHAGHSRGQAMIEMALILPILLLIVLGTLEFGFIFDHHLTLEYATREGARTGAALGNGGGPLGCAAGESPNADQVDPQIIAAVERVLSSPGARVKPNEVSSIRIYKADADGNPVGTPNVWTYDPGNGPIIPGTSVPLDFSEQSVGWTACSRSNAVPDSIGVDLTYTYRYQTALPSFIGVNSLTMHDRTVMALNPTDL